MALTDADKAELLKADAQAVEAALAQLKPNLAGGAWLDAHNPYRRDYGAALRSSTGPSVIAHSELAQFIAASSVIHCADGWSYLGRALNCHTRGDSGAASHLAYYAELRAGLAILANQGIGIFNHKHFIVDSVGTCRPIPNTSGTHQMVWWVLEHWAAKPQSAVVIGTIVAPAGVPLSDWLIAFGGQPRLTSYASTRLAQWGLDLKRMSTDRESRNLLSYGPTSLTPRRTLDVVTCSDFICDVWRLCQPSVACRFELLDRHLLRANLHGVYRDAMTPGQTGTPATTSYSARVRKTLAALPLDSFQARTMESFLTTDPGQQPLIIQYASGRATPEDSKHQMEVIARAVLLLRIATGMAAQSLRTTPISAADLEFWWKSMGRDRALWETGQDPEEPLELWDDIDLALIDADTWSHKNAGTNVSGSRWCTEQAATISTLQGCERIALWGLGL